MKAYLDLYSKEVHTRYYGVFAKSIIITGVQEDELEFVCSIADMDNRGLYRVRFVRDEVALFTALKVLKGLEKRVNAELPLVLDFDCVATILPLGLRQYSNILWNILVVEAKKTGVIMSDEYAKRDNVPFTIPLYDDNTVLFRRN